MAASAWWTPRRRRGAELLDDPRTGDREREDSMRDVARANRYFGGARALRRALEPLLPDLPRNRPAMVLDVGTGTGDLAAVLRRAATSAGVELDVIGADLSPSLLRAYRSRFDASLAADAMRLPLPDGCVDLAVCSQLLHHFAEADATRVIAELHRVSRVGVVISDLRRSLVAAGGFWAASLALGFHHITRHDGVVSVLRGFTPEELGALVHSVTGITPLVRAGAFWRISATWRVPGR